MATVVERRGEQVIYRSPVTLDIPSLDILTFLFDNPHNDKLKDDTIMHADADDPAKAVTKASQLDLLQRLAYTLRTTYGVREGDAVQVMFTGHYLAPTVFYAILAAGATVAASTPSSSPQELARQMALSESKLLISTPDLKALAAKGGSAAGLPSDRILYFGDAHRRGSSVDIQLFNAASDAQVPVAPNKHHRWRRLTDKSTLERTLACLIYSSGTTGTPKAVKVSHANVVAQTHLILTPMRRYYDTHRPSFAYRTLAHVPAAHISGLQAYFINQAYLGGTVYWMRRFDFPRFLHHARALRITMFFSVPPVFLAIARSPLVTDHFDSVDVAWTGAAPLSAAVQLEAQRRLGKGRGGIAQTWGLSETTGGFTSLPRHIPPEEAVGSVSMVLANCEARIVDERGGDVEPGRTGEVWVRGPIVTKGYLKNEQANREVFVDGWFRTGDNMYFKDGKFFYVDRRKELIKYKGFQVAPAELEALLLTHPKIADSAVIGVESEDGTELPRAYVVADPTQISAKEIQDWVAEQVASYRRLRGGVFFISAIPKSAAGKILRRELRDLVKKEKEGASKL
ncbi:AMP-binding enzyme [Sodiomyces alkalinus F11]|uniref:AMP-binding enzyme n=1 Tax=Sodiomyces alkalinus (strain CBS 110278 / VKM F-3762 / F11) TaxID=1314773 RepID=A0A3N2PL49_SODAK|nr:AMP-binding enzyme [Sodiomyces alkalinus F11]ROT35245.1 AMP-binding enzyme [Sodiomyces alkalinus F11]